ncbi:hypothetical protein DVH24_026454 [Malus domestica]|uniref:Uncharacterized protein n=1 Tax=Malus domestica TaxID=3750 RepID=A0A498KHZ6_MALDO|nr:hypothetical protein DVH24_026454 [Malus domestica]
MMALQDSSPSMSNIGQLALALEITGVSITHIRCRANQVDQRLARYGLLNGFTSTCLKSS